MKLHGFLDELEFRQITRLQEAQGGGGALADELGVWRTIVSDWDAQFDFASNKDAPGRGQWLLMSVRAQINDAYTRAIRHIVKHPNEKGVRSLFSALFDSNPTLAVATFKQLTNRFTARMYKSIALDLSQPYGARYL